MRLQNIGLGFAQKPKKDESENNSNIFLCALGGAVFGSSAGALARNYAPVSDEFFHQVSQGSSDKKNEVDEVVKAFIDSYSSVEIEDARTLKTVLMQPDIENSNPQNKGILELLQDDTIKPVSKEDSEELQNSFKVLHTQVLQEMKAAKEENSLPAKLESVDTIAAESLQKAKQAIFVKDNLQKYKKQMRGLADEGKHNIANVHDEISKMTTGSAEAREELSSAFKSMLRVAKKTQRPVEAWTVVPGIIAGLFGMGAAVNYRAQKDMAKTKKEPRKN